MSRTIKQCLRHKLISKVEPQILELGKKRRSQFVALERISDNFCEVAGSELSQSAYLEVETMVSGLAAPILSAEQEVSPASGSTVWKLNRQEERWLDVEDPQQLPHKRRKETSHNLDCTLQRDDEQAYRHWEGLGTVPTPHR